MIPPGILSMMVILLVMAAGAGLQALYNDQSMMSFEGEQFQGAANIVKKLTSLPFTTMKHNVVKADYQPNPINGGIICFVIGSLFVDSHPEMKFQQAFQLLPNG